MGLEARVFAPADLHVGLELELERDVVEADVVGFAKNSGDFNPLHVDADYARDTNFGRPIAHGAFQIGLASAMLGMNIPGRDVLLMTVQARFPSPLFYPTRVRVRGVVASWNLATMKGVLRTTVEEMSGGRLTADIHTGFTFHDHVSKPTPENPQSSTLTASSAVDANSVASLPLLLVTGASGGLGSQIVRELMSTHRVIAQVYRRRLSDNLTASAAVTEWHADMNGEWEQSLVALLGDAPLAGIIHVAWPGSPQGGLLETGERVLEEQLSFGSTQLIRLARIQATHAQSAGRVVAIGSTYGHFSPNFSLAAYSLGKSLLEDTVALLAPELARRAVTINAVCPSVVASGLNAHLNDRQKLREISKIPLGRLCEAIDVVAAVRFLLSNDASFISGQSIYLTGGQLSR